MSLLRGYAPSTERSLRFCGPAPQQPLLHSHRGREGLSVSRSGFRPADNWGMLLCCQFVTPAATKPLSSVSARPQHLPVARTGCQRGRSFPKNLLQLSSRVQGRVFCDLSNSMEEGRQPRDGSSLGEVMNKPDYALEMMGGRKILEGLDILKKFAPNEQFWNARRLLSDVVLAAGLLLCCQFVASAATKPVKAWPQPQYLPVARTAGCQKDPSFANNLLQLSARAQGRMFCCVNVSYLQTSSQPVDDSSIDTGMRKLKHGLRKINRTPSFGLKVQKETTTMLEGLSILEKFAKDLDYFCDHYNAHDVFFTVLAVNNNLHSHGLSNAEEILLKEKLLKIALLLLQNASVEIRTKLCSEITSNEKLKASLERIVRDGSVGADELRKLAAMILAEFPPSSTHK